jgi:PTS system beta-glucosides-specific IIC component
MGFLKNLFKGDEASDSKEYVIASPLTGKIVALKDVADEAFSSGMMGEGIAVMPDKGLVSSPVVGTVSVAMDSKHAVALKADNGVELLIHVGMDTVQLEGKHFNLRVKVGDKIKVGDPLIEFDMAEITKAGYPLVTPVIVLGLGKFTKLECTTAASINSGEALITLK